MERTCSSLDEQAGRPRILIVSRRHVRKNKLVDIVGEYQYVMSCPNPVPPLALSPCLLSVSAN
jgi:hypothetical protein